MTWYLEHTGPLLSEETPPQGTIYSVRILKGERGRFVWKWGTAAELADEARVLGALQQYSPLVPAPVAVHGDEALFTYVEGRPFHIVADEAPEGERLRLMGELGRAIRRLHGWTPPMPKPADWLGGMLAKVPALELDGLRATRPEIVWCHGDLCLPNALVSEGRISGVIDWSLGGYADRRYDLAMVVWSTRYNLGEERYVHALLEAYGFAEPVEVLEPWERLWKAV